MRSSWMSLATTRTPRRFRHNYADIPYAELEALAHKYPETPVPRTTSHVGDIFSLGESLERPLIFEQRNSELILFSKAPKLLQSLWDGESSQNDASPTGPDPIPLNMISSKFEDTLLKRAISTLQNVRGRSGLESSIGAHTTHWEAGEEINNKAIRQLFASPLGPQPLLSQNAVNPISSWFLLDRANDDLFVPEDGEEYMGLLHFHTSSNPNKFAHKLVLLPVDEDVYESCLFEDPVALLRAAHGLDSPSSMSCVLREGETLFIPRGWRLRGGPACLDGSRGWSSYGWTISLVWRFEAKRVQIGTSP